MIFINLLQKATKGGCGGEKEKELQEEDIEAILAEVWRGASEKRDGRVGRRAAHLYG